MRTGYYVRVTRDGRPQSLDIAELSEQEIRVLTKEWPAEKLREWVVSLAQFIKEIEPSYNSGTSNLT